MRAVSEVLREATPIDSVGVFTFSLRLQPVVSFTDWDAAAVGERVPLTQKRLQEVSPGWGATRTADALMRAAEIAADPGDRIERARDHDQRDDRRVEHHQVDAEGDPPDLGVVPGRAPQDVTPMDVIDLD